MGQNMALGVLRELFEDWFIFGSASVIHQNQVFRAGSNQLVHIFQKVRRRIQSRNYKNAFHLCYLVYVN